MKFIIDFDMGSCHEDRLADEKRLAPAALREAILSYVDRKPIGYSWINYDFDITLYEQPEPDKYDVAIEMRMATELGKLHNDYAGLQNRHAHLLVEMAQLKRELANLKCKRANG